MYSDIGNPLNTTRYGLKRNKKVSPVYPQIREKKALHVMTMAKENKYTLCRIRDGDGAPPSPPAPPPPPIIFEERNLAQQTIYHWQGNLSKSPIHFRY